MSRRQRNTAPRTMRAQYAGKCAETGADIKPGDYILLMAGKVYGAGSKQYQSWNEAEFDRVWLNVEY